MGPFVACFIGEEAAWFEEEVVFVFFFCEVHEYWRSEADCCDGCAEAGAAVDVAAVALSWFVFVNNRLIRNRCERRESLRYGDKPIWEGAEVCVGVDRSEFVVVPIPRNVGHAA